jgi:hypothetical protein
MTTDRFRCLSDLFDRSIQVQPFFERSVKHIRLYEAMKQKVYLIIPLLRGFKELPLEFGVNLNFERVFFHFVHLNSAETILLSKQ